MALEKTGPNRWRIKISVRVQGKAEPAKKRAIFEGTKTGAMAREAELIALLRRGSTERSLITNFAEALRLYADKKGKVSAPDLSRIAKLERDLGHVQLRHFPDRFEQYLVVTRNTKTCRGKLPTGATVNRIIEIVKAVFNLLVALEHIEKNPISKARFPKAAQKPRDRYLSGDERLRLLNAIREYRPYLLPFVEYNIAVPCRRGELIEASKEQYSAFTNTIYIPDSKADISIYKPVPDSLVEYFRTIPADCPWLFYRQDDSGKYHSLGDFRKAWRFCLKKAGIMHTRIHDLRHVAATDLYQAGNSERSIMDIAGWKTPMLSTYRHKDSLRSAQAIRFTPQAEFATKLTIAAS